MTLINTSIGAIEGFRLDADAIAQKSVSEDAVRLPYSGVLPSQFASASATIEFHTRFGDPKFAWLHLQRKKSECPSGTMLDWKFRIDMSDDEVDHILDPFFAHASSSEVGMSEFWYGYECASYDTWTEFRNDENLARYIKGLPNESRLKFIEATAS